MFPPTYMSVFMVEYPLLSCAGEYHPNAVLIPRDAGQGHTPVERPTIQREPF